MLSGTDNQKMLGKQNKTFLCTSQNNKSQEFKRSEEIFQKFFSSKRLFYWDSVMIYGA